MQPAAGPHHQRGHPSARRLENNVRARACAVSLFRPSLLGEESSFAFCHVAWGIACPVVSVDRSFRGEDSTAGEIGKMILDPHSAERDESGYPGSLEALSSMRAVLAQCRRALREGRCTVLARLCPDPGALTLEQVLAAQAQGDPAVRRVSPAPCSTWASPWPMWSAS